MKLVSTLSLSLSQFTHTHTEFFLFPSLPLSFLGMLCSPLTISSPTSPNQRRDSHSVFSIQHPASSIDLFSLYKTSDPFHWGFDPPPSQNSLKSYLSLNWLLKLCGSCLAATSIVGKFYQQSSWVGILCAAAWRFTCIRYVLSRSNGEIARNSI